MMRRPEDATVLVVEDEPDVQLFLRTVLEDAGFAVLTASDGETAWEMIVEQRPDFISLDLVLPKRSGHRLLRDLRKDKELSKIPVLILSAHVEDDLGGAEPRDVLNRFLREGPGRLLSKPVKPLDYVRCVADALGIEAGEPLESRLAVRDEMDALMRGASREALQAALEALRRG